ncbi:hypothetical protein MMH89_01650 [Candidatus Comchoanobacter bicostacola]|uniref:50S ribosomal protein L22 n=1 Tax=Candidatus Comchoanobacter bicostacola TaxID=2919598 RepID=A0ABY5DK49_9GAMM|nr:hypothetical protein [Candidatus Comchoanobacter bicostacola]UTC24855.1 hypothetical protein MMH89_01650 [Candidatus Comchoanobacter bicostacola]
MLKQFLEKSEIRKDLAEEKTRLANLQIVPYARIDLAEEKTTRSPSLTPESLKFVVQLMKKINMIESIKYAHELSFYAIPKKAAVETIAERLASRAVHNGIKQALIKKSPKVTWKDQEGKGPLCETKETVTKPGFWKKALLLTTYVIKQLLNALTLLIHFDLRVFSNAHKDFKANWNPVKAHQLKIITRAPKEVAAPDHLKSFGNEDFAKTTQF